jgi:hypothetical protein
MLDVRQPYWAGQADIQIAVVEAWVARAERKNAEALQRLRHAAEQEDETEKSVVAPGPMMPAREQLADLLLETGDPVAALEQFEAVQRKEPNRLRAIAGAARAAELAGNRDKARTLYTALLSSPRCEPSARWVAHRAGMDRRRFVLISLAASLAVPLGAEAQQSGTIHRVGYTPARPDRRVFRPKRHRLDSRLEAPRQGRSVSRSGRRC